MGSGDDAGAAALSGDGEGFTGFIFYQIHFMLFSFLFSLILIQLPFLLNFTLMHFVLLVQALPGMNSHLYLEQLRSKRMFILLMPRKLSLILTVGLETFLRLWIQSPIMRAQMSSSLMEVVFFSLEMKVITVMNSETLSIMKKPSACCCALHLTKLPPSAHLLKR
jgi:hypothetical protein